MKKELQNNKLNESTGEQVMDTTSDSHPVKSEVILELKIAARLLLSLGAAVFGYRERRGLSAEDHKERKEKRRENQKKKI
ncbi:MAG: hypothetical protein ABIT08_10970 [Bacteroidia bacterium]